jgi:uncharacterized protein involved in exopolysaccharide biosynthesis
MSRKMTFRNAAPQPDGKDMQSDNDKRADDAYRFEVNAFELARILLSRRRLIAALTLATMILTALYMFSKPNLYTSTAVILPSGKVDNISALEHLVGIAGQVNGYDENPSAMFPVVLNSNLIVDSVARMTYTFRHKGESHTMTLAEYFGIENPDRLRQAVRSVTAVTADQRTGEIYLRVETKYPELSQRVAANYLARLEDFNRHKRRSHARNNEQYLDRQLTVANKELRDAEDNLEAFQKANLDWAVSGSPEILKELGRLQRDVQVKSTTYAMLAQELERSRLEVHKDIPVVQLLDSPSLPTVKSGPFRRNIILLSGAVAFIIAVCIIMVWHFAAQLVAGPEKNDFEALRHDVTAAFPRANRIVNRLTTTIRGRLPLIKN